ASDIRETKSSEKRWTSRCNAAWEVLVFTPGVARVTPSPSGAPDAFRPGSHDPTAHAAVAQHVASIRSHAGSSEANRLRQRAAPTSPGSVVRHDGGLSPASAEFASAMVPPGSTLGPTIAIS